MNEEVIRRAVVRFEIANLLMMKWTVRQYFERKWMRGVQWTPEQVEQMRLR